MGGPDDYVLHCPANVERIRIATVVARKESEETRTGKTIRIVAHPESPIHFETSERVQVHLKGSGGDDVLIGPKYGGAEFHGGDGDDQLIAIAKLASSRHRFYGGAGNDLLVGGGGKDILDGGTGNDTIKGMSGRNLIHGGHGNDTISDKGGTSVIHTGPGRNRVTLGDGSDTIHVGTGENLIKTGTGDYRFVIAYGGVTLIKRWDEGHRYVLSGWPRLPEIRRKGVEAVLTLGLSVIRIGGVPEGADLSAQIELEPATAG
jgi:Ca2+-binding RTX toxin-like protein